MGDTTSKIYLSWNDINSLVDIVAERIISDYPKIDSVHGIARGGLIPAVLISHKLDLPYVQAIGRNTLVVDDICDSGKTLSEAPGVYHAVLHHKILACYRPHIFATTVLENDWIVYPWEREDSETIQDYLK